MEMQPTNKKNFLKWLGIGALVILLAAAAYAGGRMLNGQPVIPGLAGPGSLGPGTFVSGRGEAGGAMLSSGGNAVEIDVEPSDELPQRQPDAAGVFVRREDNSIFLGTGKMTMIMEAGSEEGPSSSYDGPVVEAVITKETQILRDATEPPSNPEEGGTLQQKVEPGSLDEIGENSTISVWGRKVGDRIIADVVLYSQPVFFAAPGP